MARSETGASGDAEGAEESLRAAIEHMEEGFALYDADDRLVVCNARYLSAFMPELEGEFVSGMRFKEIVALAAELGVEKVKTIGDAYMAMAGAPTPRPDHVAAVADMALGMLAVLQRFNESHDPPFKIRIGIQTGPVAAGIIGK